jgi:predicted RNA-binding Zn-ribbon protein involved in translation (DUF1610 family)
MKIKISEQESYEIQFDELTAEEFLKYAEKISLLSDGTSAIPAEKKIAKKKTKAGRPIQPKIGTDGKEVNCPNCGSIRVYRKGLSRSGQQRFMCSNCNISFTNKGEEDLTKEGKPRQRKRRRPAVSWDSRSEALKAIRIHYFGTKEDKDLFARQKGVPWEQIMKSTHNLRARYNIRPTEVGLKEFPTKKGRGKITEEEKSEPKEEPQEHKSRFSSLLRVPKMLTPNPPLELKEERHKENKSEE